MYKSIFGLLSVMLLAIQYVWEMHVPFSYSIFVAYCLFMSFACIYAGMQLYSHKSSKFYLSKKKINIKILFQKVMDDTSENNLAKKHIRKHQLFCQIMFFVMVWNIILVFALQRSLFVEYYFLSILDNISSILQDIIFRYSGESVDIIYLSDYLSIIGLHNVLTVVESYVFSFCYNEFLHTKEIDII